MPIIADNAGKMYDIPDDIFAEKMAELCKGYEMSEEDAAEYLKKEEELLRNFESASAKDDGSEVKAYMTWMPPKDGNGGIKVLPLFPGSKIPKPVPMPMPWKEPWVPRPRRWW